MKRDTEDVLNPPALYNANPLKQTSILELNKGMENQTTEEPLPFFLSDKDSKNLIPTIDFTYSLIYTSPHTQSILNMAEKKKILKGKTSKNNASLNLKNCLELGNNNNNINSRTINNEEEDNFFFIF